MAIPITSDILKAIRKIHHKPSGKVIKFDIEDFRIQYKEVVAEYRKEKGI